VEVRRIAATISAATIGSRYSLRCFRSALHLLEQLQRLARLFFVNLLERETGVGQHIISGPHVGRALDADAAMHAAKANVRLQQAVALRDAEDLSGNG
jgi:hypothetical protein